jgi:predicted Na+-dependent transporter
MLQKINAALEKILPLLTPSSVAIGILLGGKLAPYVYLTPWIFAFMTFAGSLGSSFQELAKVLTRPLPLLVNLLVLHLLMPLVAWGAGSIFYPDDGYAVTGFILAAAIPTGITSMLWVSIYRGSVPLTLSIILIDTLFSPLIVPASLSLLLGTSVEMDTSAIMRGLFYMIVLPSVLGMLVTQWSKGKATTALAPRIAPFSKVGLGVVVAINSSVVAPYLAQPDGKLLAMALLLLLLASSGYLVGWGLGKLCKWERDVTVTLTFNCGMRNITAGAVLAASYFAPPVALPVVLGMLFQQSLASLFGSFLQRVEKEKHVPAIRDTAS